MSRSCGSRVVVVTALFLAAGCQNYNFNPVGHCIVQPGSTTVTLSNISTADVLFVVDDSGSMAGEQGKLAANFSSFINNLTTSNQKRVASGLKPLDFHIAVTTTSSFINYSPASPSPIWTCSATCTGASGQVCCKPDGTPGLGPHRCSTKGASCGTAGVSCRDDCTYKDGLSGEYLHLYGELYCCNDTPTAIPVPGTSVTENFQMVQTNTDQIPCSVVGSQCGTSQQHFAFLLQSGATSPTQYACTPGVSYDGMLFPHGNFVGWANAATNPTTANPRVLHFDKSLYPSPPSSTATNRQGFTSTQLQAFFAGTGGSGTNANVVVGTCGSNQEQGLEAARFALEKALAGQQMDTYPATSGTMSATAAEWPHAGSKIVLVFLGDEDDCSSPNDPSAGIVLLPEFAGADACTRNDGGKEYAVASRYADYFMGLGHPVGAAFVVSTAESICGRPDPITGIVTTCTTGKCCQPDCPSAGICGGGNGSYPQYGGSPYYCGGQAAGTRFFQAASALQTRGADVVQGSICDPNFGLLLDQIAEIVKPVTGLELPTLPADGTITVLRIADSSGNTVKVCGRPAPAGTTPAAASSYPYDWWFTAAKDGSGNAVAVSKFVYINPQGHCLANPGETYSAEYLGKMPTTGCGPTTGDTTGDTMCRQQLGGQLVSGEEPWTCYVPGTTGACGTAAYDPVSKTGTGTCLCGPRSQQCR